MTQGIEQLKDILFNTLAALQDKDNPMDLDRAKTINETSQVMINAARSEIEFAKVNGSIDSTFFKKPALTMLGNTEKEVKQISTGTIEVDGAKTTHKMN